MHYAQILSTIDSYSFMNPGTVYPLILIAGLIVTGVLAAITWQYCKRLPREQPSSNPEPVSEAEVQAARRRELQTQVGFLSSVLNELPLADSLRISEAMLNGTISRLPASAPWLRKSTLQPTPPPPLWKRTCAGSSGARCLQDGPRLVD